jgi:protein gp37
MGETTNISWASATWNSVTGCSVVSPGCVHCYAEALSLRMGWSTKPWTAQNARENVMLHPDRLLLPIKWQQPKRIFVNSMSDVFHEEIPDSFIYKMFAVMALAPRHQFLILTKRPKRMYEWVSNWFDEHIYDAAWALAPKAVGSADRDRRGWEKQWPLPNVWLGVSVEDQRRAEERIPHLLNTPAAVRFLSCEPLLGPLTFGQWQPEGIYVDWLRGFKGSDPPIPGLDWVIDGGESGNGFRPANVDWFREIRDQCVAAGVAYFHKQGSAQRPGQYVELDGTTWHQYPAVAAPDLAPGAAAEHSGGAG